MNTTELISKNIFLDIKDTEKRDTQCCICSKKIKIGVKNKKVLSEKFTNYEYMKFKSDYICIDCAKCIKDERLRKNNFIASEKELILFKQNELKKYIFELEKYTTTPFVFAITRSFKKHNSFKCNLNYDYKCFYIQEEDKKYLFDVEKMKTLYKILENAYLQFTKDEMLTGNYRFINIDQYGKDRFIELEKILKKYRGTHQFNLLIYMLNSERRNEYIKMKKEKEKEWKKKEKQKNVQLQL